MTRRSKEYGQPDKRLIKLYMKTLLKALQDKEKGQTTEDIVSDLERDVAKWPAADKERARAQLCFAYLPLGSEKIQ
jgi:hypothetical protein